MASKNLPQNVKPNLDNPEFRREWQAAQAEVQAAQAEVQAAVIETARKLQQMTWEDVFKSKGLHWEEITSFRPPKHLGIDPFYSIRINKYVRAVVYRRGDFMVFMGLPPSHDATYDKHWLENNLKP